MKKDLSNSERWSQRIGYALMLLVLIDSIVPFTWNAYHRRQSNQTRNRNQFAFSVVDSLGKIANGKSLWPNNEFGLEAGYNNGQAWESLGLKSGSNKASAIEISDELFRGNLTVFILPDLRRTNNGNENVAAVASNQQELSLQDSDAIDFYWRQDIDAEKGLYPSLWSPDLQYERDVQLVTEKTLLQPDYTDTNFRYCPDQTELLRELFNAQKESFTGFDNLPTSTAGANSDGGKVGGWTAEKTPFVFQSTTTQQEQQPSDSGSAFAGAANHLDIEWLNASTVDPFNDVFLDPGQAQTSSFNMDQGPSTSEYSFLGAASNDLNTPPVSMEWESRPDLHASNIADQNRADTLTNGLFSFHEFDSLPTPDLMLAPTDAASIFADRQVVQDIVEAQTTKEMFMHHSPITTIDAIPSTSAGVDVMAFVPTAYDDSQLDERERSEVIIDALGPYNDPFSVPSTSWQQPIPASAAAWHPQSTSATGTSSYSPTWSGDHDYTWEAASGRESSTSSAEWSHGNGMTVKTEVDAHYDDDDDEEDSSEQRARAASERDELRARQLALPFTAAEIVIMTQQEYISIARSKGRYTREQLELIKEIRRHGGNKEAARRSRQKKVEMTKQLEDEVTCLEKERDAMFAEHQKLLREIELEERAIENLKRKGSRK